MTVKELRARLFEIEDQDQEITPEQLAELTKEEYNNDTVISIELKRIEVCDLLIASLAAYNNSNDDGEKWKRIHDKIGEQLHKTDKANGWR